MRTTISQRGDSSISRPKEDDGLSKDGTLNELAFC
jgi:hypothetical protein